MSQCQWKWIPSPKARARKVTKAKARVSSLGVMVKASHQPKVTKAKASVSSPGMMVNQCHNCLRYGHYANECWQPKGSAQVGQVAESEVSKVAPSASVSQAHVKRVEIDLTSDCTYDFSGSARMIVASSAGSNLLPMVGASDAGSELQSDSGCKHSPEFLALVRATASIPHALPASPHALPSGSEVQDDSSASTAQSSLHPSGPPGLSHAQSR